MSLFEKPRLVFPGTPVSTDSRRRNFNRWGGFVITHESLKLWAARILNKDVNELTNFQRKCAIIYPLNRVEKYGFTMATVGEEREQGLSSTHGMLVTQHDLFVGPNNMPVGFPNPAVEDFVEGENEKRALELLTAHGASQLSLKI
ncbi:hypothetical protein CPB83DRAFT_855165 [Crepidotus variabilis]|uniref:Uncharacterized protein n=1 Tax=Crepidotus variabilis TaxID=179855 RepID=A0A9P6EFA9_9AGAR|nr:hypothetical protein CPB83DRAFT_855165 [Crepidotus variabilis]